MKPNYSFEKRQREIAKKKKQDEKLAKKKRDAGTADASDNTASGNPDSTSSGSGGTGA
ncbi:MAG TPA: hypothetical protein VM687_12030 [Stenotrophomonas sp.]|nr:hypothetical protein [Stenotrophomonas sp.]